MIRVLPSELENRGSRIEIPRIQSKCGQTLHTRIDEEIPGEDRARLQGTPLQPKWPKRIARIHVLALHIRGFSG
jgi:hypothetical protein